MIELNLWLHAVNVSIVAREPTPELVTHDFLVKRDIVPKEWKPLISSSISDVANSIAYDNQVRIELDRSRITFSQICASDISYEPEIFDLAVSYLRRTRKVPYHSIGLRWEILTYFDNPQEWLHKHFSNPDRTLPDNYYLEPRYIVIRDDTHLQISFHVADITPTGKERSLEALAIQATIEFANLPDANRLIRISNRWRQYRDWVQESITTILESAK